MKKFSNDNYDTVQTITHLGIVFAFGGRQSADGNIIEYRILDVGSMNPDNPIDENNWTDVKELSFPNELRQVGMNLVTVSDPSLTALNKLNFVAYSDEKYVYIFRQNHLKTLQVDRFVFVPSNNALEVSWETRYQRSGRKDVPSGSKDTLGFNNMDGEPFQEPSIALPMTHDLADNGFSIALTSSVSTQTKVWHIFALDNDSGKMNYFGLPASDTDIFDLTTKKFDPTTGAMIPDQSFTLNCLSNDGTVPLPFTGGQDSCLYYKQEETPSIAGKGTTLKRNQRLMNVFTVRSQNNNHLAVVDFGIAKDGTLAELGETLTLPIIPAPSSTKNSPMTMLKQDENMLNICGGFLDFAVNASAPNLLDSADGHVHLYFENAAVTGDQSNYVAISYSAQTQRVHFALPTNDGNTLEAIGRQNGAAMNQSLVSLVDGSDANLCNVELRYTPTTSPRVKEEWSGVPRDLKSYLTVFQGGAVSNPNNPAMKLPDVCFYDYSARWYQQAISVESGQQTAGFVRLISRLPKHLLTESQSGIRLTNGASNDLCNMVLNLVTDSLHISETWNNLPRDSAALTNILLGQDNHFDYANNTSQTLTPYRIAVGSGWLWLVKQHNQSASGKVVISITGLDTCVITLADAAPAGSVVETWKNMPRDGARIADILLGKDSQYDYATNAYSSPSANLSSGSKLYTPINAEAVGQVEETYLEYVPTLRGGSALFCPLNVGNGSITNTVTTTVQGITAVEESRALTNHVSSIFTFALLDSVADLSEISMLNCPTALCNQHGKDSEWIAADTEYSLQMSYSCIDFPANKLNFAGDMTLEAWVNPSRLSADQFSRVLSYRSDTNSFALGLKPSEDGENSCSFFAGYREQAVVPINAVLPFNQWSYISATYQTGQCLLMNGLNIVNFGTDRTQNTGAALSIEAWSQFPTSRNDSFIILSKFGSMLSDQSYQLSYEAGNLVLQVIVTRQVGVANPTSYSISRAFNPDLAWHYICASCDLEVSTDSEGNTSTELTMSIYVDGIKVGDSKSESLRGNVQIQPTDTALTMGGTEYHSENPPTAFSTPFKISEARLWSKALTATDVWNNFECQGLGIEANELVSYWELMAGEGLEVSDTEKVNTGMISSTRMWQETQQGAVWKTFLNGELIDSTPKLMSEFGGYGNDDHFRMGCQEYGEDLKFPYLGYLDEVYIWNLARTEEQLSNTMYAVLGGSEDGLLGYWNFNKGSGSELIDQTTQALNGQFIDDPLSELHVNFELSDQTTLLMKSRFEGDVHIVGYQPGSAEYKVTVDVGQRNAMYILLDPETESIDMQQNGGDWVTYKSGERPKLTVGSGVVLTFKSSRRANFVSSTTSSVALSVPVWNTASTAPVGEEAPQVRPLLNGQASALNQNISAQPSTVEYGDMQLDSEGNLLGVMNRCYCFVDSNKQIQMVTGFRVGDLDLQFIGQVQTQPTLIGYIEGPPPVPSENLTVNNPVVDDYAGTSSIALTEASDVEHVYQMNDETAFNFSTEFKVGIYGGTKMSAGVAVQSEVAKFEMQGGLYGKFATSSGSTTDKAIKAGSSKTFVNQVETCGAWEFPKDYTPDGSPQYLNPEVGRRYIPNNMGYALVKSGTADLFALRLKRKGTVVSYQVTPKPEIPEDFNIIMFPIKASYQKNGTLDGMVGLVADEDYPNAILGERGSYFKPEEAYTLKASIDKEEAEVRAYFEQTNGGNSQPSGRLLRDWENKISKRSLVNTYVWSAPGGLYSEERQFSDFTAESSGSTFHFESMGGVSTEGKFRAGGVGVFFELDLLFGGHYTVVKMAGSEQSNTFGLSVNVTGEGWLNAWNDKSKVYEPFDCPGKVDTYRFMSYRLSPQESHFDTFFDKVVDDNWLRSSTSPSAIALNEVMASEKNPVWRVLHRVTFVSRVPPSFEPAPVETIPPSIVPPDDVSGNVWLLNLVKGDLGQIKQPSPNQIGQAVDQALDVTLVQISPSWAAFYANAKDGVTHPEEAEMLHTIRLDTKRYFLAYFDAIAAS